MQQTNLIPLHQNYNLNNHNRSSSAQPPIINKFSPISKEPHITLQEAHLPSSSTAHRPAKESSKPPKPSPFALDHSLFPSLHQLDSRSESEIPQITSQSGAHRNTPRTVVALPLSTKHDLSRRDGLTCTSAPALVSVHPHHTIVGNTLKPPLAPPFSSSSSSSPSPLPSPCIANSKNTHHLYDFPCPGISVVKRPRTDQASQPHLKRHRSNVERPTSIDLPLPRMDVLSSKSKEPPVTSPLFFSNSPRNFYRRPSFSPSEAATVMLANIRGDDSDGVTTLKLARGTVSDTSSARSTSTPGSWSSADPGSSAVTVTGIRNNPDNRNVLPGQNLLHGLGVLELLDQDERPTFMIDLLASTNNEHGKGFHILYANPALCASQGTSTLISEDSDTRCGPSPDFSRFKAWATSFTRKTESLDVALPPHTYGGISWTSSTLRRRFRFIRANTAVNPSVTPIPTPIIPTNPREDASHGTIVEVEEDEAETEGVLVDLAAIAAGEEKLVEPDDYFGSLDQTEQQPQPSCAALDRTIDHTTPPAFEDHCCSDDTRHHTDDFTNRVLLAQPTASSFDWTRIPLSSNLPEHIMFARTVDWASTPLGPIEDWCADLRTMSNLVMGSPHPAAMYWGPQHIAIYNAAYIDLAGQKHPSLMGTAYSEAWAEIWPQIEHVFTGAWDSGQATMKRDNQLFINRHGYVEESFFSWSIVPLVGGDGQVVGLYNPAFENTRRKVNERWMLTLREVGEKTSAAKDVRSFWPQVKKGLEYNDIDVPFALIYAMKEDGESDVSSLHSGSLAAGHQLVLEASIGVPEGHCMAPLSLDLRCAEEGFAPFMREIITTTFSTIVLSEEDNTLPTYLFEGVEWRGFGDACRTIVVMPVAPTTAGESIVGFIVMGTNPRRPYDDDYRLFVDLLSRQLATSLASVVLFEEEIKRGQRAARLAALDRQELSLQLYLKSQEADESEYKFTRMAEFAPVGMFIANPHGKISYCNDMWWQISRHNRSVDTVDTWMESVKDEDRPQLETVWRQLINDKVAITHEFRFKCSRQKDDLQIDTWALMSAYPEKDANGALKLIFGCITDISPQKWAEDFQKKRREEAVELKRQQENFIDITSHEMRNPLSAILQCADEIVNGISNAKAENITPSMYSLLENCTEAASTINLCASHQKRIVDDILTLSKLDSQLLLVTPVDTQPKAVVEKVIKMFESELNSHDIKLEMHIEDSFKSHGIDWVRLDPSRLRQVLINLMTNAIKFTRNRETRHISVSIGASTEVEQSSYSRLNYIPTRRPDQMHLTNDAEWGEGDETNLHFSVTDTGPGLDDDEKQLLFQRFSQTSPRTHVQYGGSGLGLFISRILTELQGGQVGVASTKGVGSTFSFYVKSRKSQLPVAETVVLTPPVAKPVATGSNKDLTRVPTPKISTIPSHPAPLSAQPTSPTQEERAPFDVLIVEDNLVNQRVLQRQLRNCGSITQVANHGGEALEKLQASQYWIGREADGTHIDVILMDLEMPVMDGVTCARRIRGLEREGTIVRHIPIIAVTAYARPEQIETAKSAGVDDVISKPFRIPELIPKIKELLAKYGS